MVTLTSPITAQNIVDRFEELVTDVADTNIVWGTDSLPGHSAFRFWWSGRWYVFSIN